MPEVKQDTIPVCLKPFTFFGVEVEYDASKDESVATCPFCDREGKFYINNQTGQWHCVGGNTQVLTRQGYYNISSLAGKEVELLSHLGWKKAEIKSGGIQKVLNVSLIRDRHKKIIKATSQHRWILRDGRETITGCLHGGDRLASVIAPQCKEVDIEGIRHGIMYGDGNQKHVTLWGPKRELLRYLLPSSVFTMKPLESGVEGIRVNGQKEEYKTLPTLDMTDEYLLGFLQGYMATDGTAFVQTCIDSANESAMERVREIAARLGFVTAPVKGYWRKGIEDHEGYLYRVGFHRCTLYPEFFLRSDHREAVENSKSWGGIPRLSWRVESILLGGEEEVFCAVVPVAETFALDDNLLTGNCKICESGNIYTFLKRTYEESSFVEGEGKELSSDRRIEVNTLSTWGLHYHDTLGEWILPGYNAEGKISNLYRRLWNHLEKRFYFNGPKGLSHGLIGHHLWDQNKDDCFICEGIWDACALWELLTTSKYNDLSSSNLGNRNDADSNKYLPTSNPELALYSNANIIAVPSATVFNEYWPSLFAGKRVYLCYDNDHPSGKSKLCGALEGMRHAASVLLTSTDPPKEVHYIKWGETQSKSGIVGYDPTLKHGYDLRDLFTASDDPSDRREALHTFFSLLEPVPPSWIEGAKGSKGKPIVPTIQCTKYSEVLSACEKSLVMSEGMRRGLAVMLACTACVEVGEDQLWMKFISPPATGKTTLAEGIVMAKKYACIKSITTGLHSGFRDKNATDGKNDDFSLINMIKNMAVVIKDGDTLLKADQLNRILSELRDAYDRFTSTHYRNRVVRNYEDHSFALLLCGTSALRYLDDSELGQRFLDCVIMEEIESRVEDEVADQAINQFELIMAGQAILNGERLEGKNKQHTKQIIGGYVEYLRKNVLHLISEIRMPPEIKQKIKDLAKFVAIFRGRPSKLQTEAYTREMSPRLIKQLGKLAYGLTVVLQKKVIDNEVMQIVTQCALDTARGDTLRIAHVLIESTKRTKVKVSRSSNKYKYVLSEGLDMVSLSQKVNIETRFLKKLLIYMRGIKAIETAVRNENVGIGSRMLRWKLTDDVKKVYSSVVGVQK